MIPHNFFLFNTHKVLVGIVSIRVCRIDDSIFLGLLDDGLHVLDILDGHRHELLQQVREDLSECPLKRKESLHVLAQNFYLSVLQVPVDVLDQLPHRLLQAPEQLLLSVKCFVSHLWRSSITPQRRPYLKKLSFFWPETSLIYLWFNSGEDLEISGKSVAFFTDGVDVELVQFAPQRAFVLHPLILHHCKQN